MNFAFDYSSIPLACLCVAIAILGLVTAFFWARRRVGQDISGSRERRRPNLPKVIFSVFVVCLLSCALVDPRMQQEQKPLEPLLIVGIDVSESALRDRPQWREQVQALARQVAAQADAGGDGEGVLFVFGKGTDRKWRGPLRDLPSRLYSLSQQSNFEGMVDETDLTAFLLAADEIQRDVRRPVAVVLISDGNQTVPRPDEELAGAVAAFAGRGTPIHISPINSPGRGLLLDQVFFPRVVDRDVENELRIVIRNWYEQPVTGRMVVERISALPTTARGGDALPSALVANEFTIKGNDAQVFRYPVAFPLMGLDGLVLNLEALTGEDRGRTHQRTVYTYVRDMARAMIMSSEHKDWTRFLNTDEWAVEQTSNPDSLINSATKGTCDLVVLDAIAANTFSQDQLNQLRQAITVEGVGLLLLNGKHINRTKEDGTVLLTYRGTPLEDILPVIPGPRPFQTAPPPVHLALMVDTSGSMAGVRLHQAKRICAGVIDQLRDGDRLSLITFSGKERILAMNRHIQDYSKGELKQLVEELGSGGGTIPSKAISTLKGLGMQADALMFISDGEFPHDEVKALPDNIQTLAYDVARTVLPANSPLSAFKFPFAAANLGEVRVPFLTPRDQNKFFEEGAFVSINRWFDREPRILPDGLSFSGSAVSHAREGGEVIGLRPELFDPVLAFGVANHGRIGVLTTGLPESWKDEKGRTAVSLWGRNLLAFSSRDRYDFRIELDKRRLKLSVDVRDEHEVPEIDSLAVTLAAGSKAQSGSLIGPDERLRYNGTIDLISQASERKQHLTIRERGVREPDRTQRLPIWLPPDGSQGSVETTNERRSQGTNRELLEYLARSTGGDFPVTEESLRSLFRSQEAQIRAIRWWPYLAVSAAFVYLSMIAVERWPRGVSA